MFSLLDAALGLKSKNLVASHDYTLMLTAGITVDPSSSQISSGSPSAANRNFVRQRALYVDLAGSSLRSIASCGLAFSTTDPKQFGPLLFDNEHRHRSQCVLLLSRLAAYSMSYMGFLGMIRCILGPLLVTDGSDGRVRLPVISSSVGKSYSASEPSASQVSSDSSKQRDDPTSAID